MKKIILILILACLLIAGGYKVLEYKAKSGLTEARQKALQAGERSVRSSVLVGLEVYSEENKTLPNNLSVLAENKLIEPGYVERVEYKYIDGKNATVCLRFDPKEYGEKQCVDFVGK